MASSKLLFLFVSGLPCLAASECEFIHVLRARLMDEERLSPKTLDEAREEAAWVLRSLCVDLVWTSESEIRVIEIRILATPLTPDVPKQSLGPSLVIPNHGLRAAVFLLRVREAQCGPVLVLFDKARSCLCGRDCQTRLRLRADALDLVAAFPCPTFAQVRDLSCMRPLERLWLQASWLPPRRLGRSDEGAAR
jgi:hypothetical protein